jgi:hypothetical protein
VEFVVAWEHPDVLADGEVLGADGTAKVFVRDAGVRSGFVLASFANR